MEQYLKGSRNYIIIEPFQWLFVALFQPAEFAKTYEREKIRRRIGPMFRLVIPLLLTLYLFMLFVRLIRVVLYESNLIYAYNPYSIDNFFNLSQFVLLSIILGLLFIILDSIQFGITFCIGTGIAFSMLSILIHAFNPAESDTYIPSYVFQANLLTGFAIGILFATAFAITGNTGNTAIQIRKGIIRGIGFGVVLFIILQHLENAAFQDLWGGITSLSNSSGITSGIIGCVITGIALSIAGDIIIDSSAGFRTSLDKMIVKGLTGGIVFAITFAFILTLIPPSANSYSYVSSYASDMNSLGMVSILLGFLGGFLASMKGTVIKWLTTIIGIIIVGALILISSYNFISGFSILKTISSNTSPFSFAYQAILSLALGFVGGSLISNRDSRRLTWICIGIFLFELVNLQVGRLANVFVVTYEPGIISGIMAGLAAGVITWLVRVFLKNMDEEHARGITRGIIFTVATVIAAISLGLAKLDSSTYTNFQRAITIGIGCLAGYLLVYYRNYPKHALSAIRTNIRSGLPWRRLLLLAIITIFLIMVAILVAPNNPQVAQMLTVLGILIGLLPLLGFPATQSKKNEQDIADITKADTIQTTQGVQATPTPNASSQGASQQPQAHQAPQPSPASTIPPAQSTNNTMPGQEIETLFCDQCGAPVRPGAHFCNRCGKRLLFCDQCGAPVRSGAHFCNRCRARLS